MKNATTKHQQDVIVIRQKATSSPQSKTGSGFHEIVIFVLSHMSTCQMSSRLIQPFCRAHPVKYRQTDRQTDRPRHAVCSNRPHLYAMPIRCGLIIIKEMYSCSRYFVVWNGVKKETLSVYGNRHKFGKCVKNVGRLMSEKCFQE